MTPERVKAIRHALRRSDGRKPTQRQVSKFLRMGEVSLPRYESGAQTPTDSHALLLEMLTDRHIVNRIAKANEREGIFSDIRIADRCWQCEGYNTAVEMVDIQERGRGNVPPFTYQRGLITCQDCGTAWYDQEWRDSLSMAGFKAALRKRNPVQVLLNEHKNS